MKKLSIFVLLVTLLLTVFVMASCDTDQPQSTTAPTPNNEATTAHQHTWGEWATTTTPTCEEKGVETRTCSECQTPETREIEAKGHTNKAAVIENKVEATCTTDGSYDNVIYCAVCDDEISREVKIITTSGHRYNSDVTAPTVKEQGFTTHTCSVCSDSYVDSYVPATGSLGLAYEVDFYGYGSTCTITGMGTCTDTEIYIPESIDGYKVTAIGPWAFDQCTEITEVTILNNITSIGDYAFEGCTSLTNITIPDSVTSIGDGAFERCTSFTSIVVPDSVTSIGGGAFEGCSQLERLTLPFVGDTKNGSISYTSLGYIFGSYSPSFNDQYVPISLKEVVITGGDIGRDAFLGCSNITSITIPSSATAIGTEAFYRCSGLTSITIPDSVTIIGMHAFAYCSNLEHITIGNSVATIGYEAFKDCSNLRSITIPGSVTKIYQGAFKNCRYLRNITIGQGMTTIDDYTFCDCYRPESIVIPVSITSIGHGVFQGSYRHTVVYYGGNATDWEQINFGTSDNESFLNAPRYYYSENQPTDATYKYWHYVDGVPTAW